MGQTIHSLFLHLLRVALGNAEEMDVSLSDREWESLMDMAVKQSVAGIVFCGIEKLPKKQMPPLEMIMEWSAVVDYIENENRYVNSMSVKICEMFERDGKRACIVKGASMGVLYPKPLRRDAGDVDVWMAGGYGAVSDYVRQKFSGIRGGDYGRHLEVDIDGVLVEFHFMPAELYAWQHRRHLKKLYREIEAQQWNCRAELEGGESVIVPKLEYSLIIVIVHLFSHFAVEGVGMKQVLDCYLLLEEVAKGSASEYVGEGKSADEIRNEAMAFFRKVGIGKFVAALMYVLQQLGMDDTHLLCVPDERLGKRVLDEIQKTGVVPADELVTGKYGNESKLHRLYRRFRRALHLMPMAPSEMLWMLQSGISYWIIRKR